MSIVSDRRCDGCGEIRPGEDQEWYALIPPGWNGEDYRLDFCVPECLRKFVRSRGFQAWGEDREGRISSDE
jgi:hypothetical protein